MTPAQREAIVQHGFRLQRIFPLADPLPTTLCKKLRQIENRAHRNAEAICNGTIEQEEADKVSDSCLKSADRVLGFIESGIPVFVNMDPRGYALKIDEAWLSNARTVSFHDRPVYTGPEADCWAWLHRKQSASVQYATTHGGYRVDPVKLHRDWGGYGIIAPEIDRNGHS